MAEDNMYRVNALPTKDFFIFMLVKDIDLIDSIAELVDNSVDGATRLRHLEGYKDLFINIEVNPSYFKITDNCGGIPADIARNYAFRFGRAEEMPTDPYLIGEFGVGMKRAIFKMGNIFEIESNSTNSFFIVEQNILEWAKDKANWDFEFKVLNDHNSQKELGTVIKVSELHRGVSAEFSLENFKNRLYMKLEAKHQLSLEKGLTIKINDKHLEFKPSQLLESETLKPTYKEIIIESVRIKIYAGISKSDPTDSGWYIYCNNRLILEADKTDVTGWGDSVPRFHPMLARFRGYVFFESENPKYLPWTTTKTGIDTTSEIYRSVRLEMINIMKIILSFINRLNSEKNYRDIGQVTELEENISMSSYTSIQNLVQQSQFHVTETKKRPEIGRIQYCKQLKDINKIKDKLNIKTFKEVGEKTFDYFLDMECDE